MSDGALVGKPWARCGLVFAFWTLIGLSFASQLYISSSKAGIGVSWQQAVSWALGDWYVFALLAVPVFRLAKRFRLDSSSWPRSLCVHLSASVAFSFAYIVLRAWVGQWQSWAAGRPAAFGEALWPLLLKTWHLNLVVYWVIAGVRHGLDYYRESRERELRAAELEKRLAQARLEALQMQLNPHFLFNTLHTISALMHRDVKAADHMISRLGDLLRLGLDSANTQEVPLRKELEFLERYLEIERTRFGERLTVRTDIDGETLDARVPNLVLQPLVENAIRHGIESHAEPGWIELSSRRDGEKLVLEVRDNGAGLPENGTLREGIGLSNTRARLDQLYGDDSDLELQNAPHDGGLIVRVTIPCRLESGRAAG